MTESREFGLGVSDYRLKTPHKLCRGASGLEGSQDCDGGEGERLNREFLTGLKAKNLRFILQGKISIRAHSFFHRSASPVRPEDLQYRRLSSPRFP